MERPILFSAPMVRAILDGRKTVTRRPVTVPWKGSVRVQPYSPYWEVEDGALLFCDVNDGGEYKPVTSPYGVPGDRLWVRETWGLLTGNGHRVVYRADGEPTTGPDNEPVQGMKWRPSIFLRREHSRLRLEVVSVRVERLHDIAGPGPRMSSEAMEHAERETNAEGVYTWMEGDHTCNVAEAYFAPLWNQINGPRGMQWDVNPWVWRIEFKRSEAK